MIDTNDGFIYILQKARSEKDAEPPECLLALDPGETTGWSVFKDGHLALWGQTDCVSDRMAMEKLFNETQPTAVVCEDYRIYAHKSEQHIGKELFTPKLIGIVEYLCELRHLPIRLQSASMAKNFCTDDKLKKWGYYKKGQRHSRDSIRHGCYYLLFQGRNVRK